MGFSSASARSRTGEFRLASWTAIENTERPILTMRLACRDDVRLRGAREEIAAEHREEDAGAGEDAEPWLAAHRRLRLVEHVAPTRRGWLHADAEEAEGTLEKNPAADGQRERDGDGRHDAGKDVANDDARRPRAGGARGGDEVSN